MISNDTFVRQQFNSLASDKILDCFKSETFADVKLNVIQTVNSFMKEHTTLWEKEKCWFPAFSAFLTGFFLKNISADIIFVLLRISLPSNNDPSFRDYQKEAIKNIDGKEENAGHQHFLLSQQCFQNLFFPEVV